MKNKNNLPNRWLARGLCLTAASALALLAACGGGDIYSEPVLVPSSTPTNTPAPTNTPTPLPYAVIHSFATDGKGVYPKSGLMGDGAGNFYGTTFYGGTNDRGTAYKVTSSGTVTVLHSFVSASNALGLIFGPETGLVADGNGNFFGTTYVGGANSLGTVYKITSEGNFSVLHAFSGGSSDGSMPRAELVAYGAGDFYGTTIRGGANDTGTVYKITDAGDFTLLHSFGTGAEGSHPNSPLLADGVGNFYGTSYDGGANGFGTVYKITAAGDFRLLHSFVPDRDGKNPKSGLVSDGLGNFYGTASTGGPNDRGTAYKITENGDFTLLHSFNPFIYSESGNDGAGPIGVLVPDGLGNFYGTTEQGGAYSRGTVYKMTGKGLVTVLHAFGAIDDGAYPSSGLVSDSSGYLYGTTNDGGANNLGTVFRIPMQ